MTRELLDLSLIVDRPTVRLRTKANPGGTVYEILNPAELGLWEMATLERLSVQLSTVDLGSKPTPAQEKARRKTLLDITGLIAPAIEPKLRNALTDVQMLALFGGFSGLIEHDPGESDQGNPGGGQTRAASSRAFNASTAAHPKRGSTSRSTS